MVTRRQSGPDGNRPLRRGFTLVELLVTLAIVATLLSIAAPRYLDHLDRARAASLRQTLNVVREAVDKYFADHDAYPDQLDELTEKRYLRSRPVDPVTDSDATWVIVPPPPGLRGSVYDVRSGAPGNGRDGRPYAEW